jgi:hypothetical protein
MVACPSPTARWSSTTPDLQEDPMSTTSPTRSRSLTVAAAVVASTAMVALAAPAQASGGNDVVRRGSCAGATDWKLKVGPDDGKLEVEGQIDSNHAGQTWRWRLIHNGSTVAHGTRTTQAPSGSFEVRRLVGNQAGTDHLTFRARNVKSDELCVGRASF